MKANVKVLAVLTLLTLFIAVMLPSTIVQSTVLAKSDSNGSTIGGVDIENVKPNEIEEVLQVAIDEWKSHSITIEGGGISVEVDPNLLEFDIAGTISDYEQMAKKPWYAFWEKKKNVHLPLRVQANEELEVQIQSTAIWHIEETINAILMKASYLKDHKMEAIVQDINSLDSERISFSIEEIPKNAKGIQELAEALHDQVIASNTVTSLVALLGDTNELANSETLNFVASMVYHVILQTDYEIIKRHTQGENPVYLQPGIEAAINPVLSKDLQFMNTYKQPSVLKVTIEGNSMKIELFSQVKEKEVTVHVKKDKIVKPRIITRYSEDLAIGQEQTVQEGKEGSRVEIFRSIVEDGMSSEELVSKEFYPATNKIIVKSSRGLSNKEGSSNEAIPDPDLEMDLNGDGLGDNPNSTNNPNNGTASSSSTKPNPPTTGNTSGQTDPEIVYGYYDKGGNFIQISP